MPKFPGRSDVSSPQSLRSGRQVVSAGQYDTSAKWAGLAKVGSALEGLGGDLAAKAKQDAAEQNALDVLKADVAHRKGLIDLDAEIDNDPDYGTHEQKFTQRSTELADGAAQSIRDPKTRERWRLRAESENQGQRGKVIGQADKLRREDNQNQLYDTLDGYRTIYTSPKSSPEQRLAARKAMDDAITAGERTGILRPGEARKWRRERLQNLDQEDIERRRIEDPEGLLRDLEGSGVDQKAPGLKTPGNLDLSRRPIVKNADGSVSTIKSLSVNIGGTEVLLPSIDDDGKEMTPDEAVKRFERTGEHLGMFDTPENATRYAKSLSERQGKRVGSISKAMITAQLETGQTDPLQGVRNISRDAGGSKSYGNFGLNTGDGKSGSLQDFVKEYGEYFGLDDPSVAGRPGSAKFDKYWRKIAATDPERLHSLEMQWYEAEVLPRITTGLKGNGVSDAISSDARVQAYIADRLVQYGPHSLDTYSQRIQRAAEAAGGDPLEFMRALSEADAANLESDFRTFLSTAPGSRSRALQGLHNRVTNREKLSVGSIENDQPGGMYPSLTPLQRAAEVEKTREAIRKKSSANRDYYERMLDDHVASLRETGVGRQDLDLEGAQRVLGDKKFAEFERHSAEANYEYQALNDLDFLNEGDLGQRLEKLRPVAGEADFEVKNKVYDKAVTRAKQIRDVRLDDPARSVTEFSDVREASSAAAKAPGDPTAVQNLIRARLDAQERVGIPDNIRSPVTVQEARALAGRVRGLTGASLTAALVPLQEELRNTYGEYAHSVGVAMVETITRDRELSERVQGTIDRVFRGQSPSAAQIRETEILNEGAMAVRAMGGDYVRDPMRQYGMSGQDDAYGVPQMQATPFGYFGLARPPAAAILKLQANPALAPMFDAKYGAGAAGIALSTPLSQEVTQ